MVAHNAHFDMGFIEKELKAHGLYDKEMTSIDTLSIARNCYSEDLKRFNLKAVAKQVPASLKNKIYPGILTSLGDGYRVDSVFFQLLPYLRYDFFN